MTNVIALRSAYVRLRKTLRNERAMRDRVFAEGHPKRLVKLDEIDQALDDLAALGDALREVLDNTPEQLKLIKEPSKYP